MSNVLTPKEWKDDNYPNIDWNDKRVSEYAVYYHSKMQEQGIKKDIILPEYSPVNFAEWILKEKYEGYQDEGKCLWGHYNDETDYTTDELYKIFAKLND